MRLFLLIIGCLFLFSCNQNEGVPYTKVNITKVFEDSLSIRAIAPVNDSTVWFAANNGRIGVVEGTTPKLATIKYEDSLLQFRAIALTSKAAFVLSIGDPGVLYKIGYEGSQATQIEEVYVERGPKVFYDAMAFWDDKDGIAMGDPTDGCLSIIKTKDGGESWEKIPCDVLPPIKEGEAAFAASNTNIALSGSHVWIATGGKHARVFHSADKGTTWEVTSTPMLQGKTMTGIYSIDFWDDKHGIIYGGDWENKEFNEGNKAITKDGGKTWKLISNGEGPGYRSCISYVPGGNGAGLVAVGSPGISYSANNGAEWKELSDEGFYAVSFVNDSVAFASGRNKIARLVFSE